MDASIYLYGGMRYHGPDRCDRDGAPCGALIGLADTLARVCERGATRVVCAFDGPREQLARRQLYPPYKAQRPAVTDAMQAQRTRAPELVRALGFSGWLDPVFEADDIIATLAKASREQSCAVVVVSADRDLWQVLQPGDEFWNVSAGLQLSFSAAGRKLRLRPDQLPDLLALCGDAADNIPGVPGVTRSVAVKLLRRWGDIDNLYANLEAVSRSKLPSAPVLAASLREHASQVVLAMQLSRLYSVPDVTLDTEGPRTSRVTREAVYAQLDLSPETVSALEGRWPV